MVHRLPQALSEIFHRFGAGALIIDIVARQLDEPDAQRARQVHRAPKQLLAALPDRGVRVAHGEAPVARQTDRPYWKPGLPLRQPERLELLFAPAQPRQLLI